MKSKAHSLILAASATALAAPAFAQSSVTLYGVLDGGLLSISNASASPLGYIPSTAAGGHLTALKDGGLGGSNWGVRGREDLGGGLNAFFQLQGNLNVSNGTTGGPNSLGTTSFFNQYAVVGMDGKWGEVKAGRVVSPMYWALASTDARGGRYFGSALTALVGMNSASGAFIGNNSNVAFGTVYNDNALVYATPVWNRMQANLEYAIGETAGSGSKANSQEAATWTYTGDALRLSALYYNGYGNNLSSAQALFGAKLGSAAAGNAAATAAGFSPTANTNRLTSVGALYNFTPAWSVAASYYQARNPAHAILPGGSASLDMWSVGGGWKVMPNFNITAGYYHITDKTNSGNHATQFAIGGEYALSRRTVLYVEGADVHNHGNNMNLSPIYSTPVVANADSHALMVGMRHSF